MIQVLIIEDDPMVAQINKKYLASLPNFLCVGVQPSGTEGLAFLKENTVDLVLLDIFMPGENGLDFLVQLRRSQTNVDVIVISAASDMPTIKSALRLGAVDYLIKPFEFDRLQASLLKYFKEHRVVNQQDKLSQEELDQLLWPNRRESTDGETLPKGITEETLRNTVQAIKKNKGNLFSTEELANLVGISRVSMRKYLKFLTDIGYLSLELDYRSTGRPINRFCQKSQNEGRLKPYLEGSRDKDTLF